MTQLTPDLKDLARRVSELHGPSPEIDAEIATLIGIESRSRRDRNGRSKGREWLEDRHGGVETWGRQPPAYTASLDAAMTLVPEGAALSFARSFIGSCSARVVDIDLGNASRFDVEAVAATPALALTAAALIARSEA